jgi:uncharacterized protein YfiM (DUF2279 family)
MERIVAIKRLGKLLGKSMGYRVDPKAPTAEEREEALRQLPALNAETQQAEKAMQDYRTALLAGDQKYQELVATWQDVRKRRSKTVSITHHFKITVGNGNGMFFSVMGQGDSWEDVIRQVEKK